MVNICYRILNINCANLLLYNGMWTGVNIGVNRDKGDHKHKIVKITCQNISRTHFPSFFFCQEKMENSD